MTARSPRPNQKPWPMKWVVAAIVVFAAGYTLVNLYFRKPGQAYRPYQDAQDRATTARLLAAGWHKMPVELRLPVEKASAGDNPASVTRAAVGLGPDLAPNFAEAPNLLASIDRVVAPASVVRGGDYSAYFTASLVSQKAPLGELALYRKGNSLVFIASSETLPGKQLMSRWPDSTYCLNFSTAGLEPGRYQARLVAKGPAVAWSFTVR
jgi:hypothetical protein